jgi:anti-anti-sigma factor
VRRLADFAIEVRDGLALARIRGDIDLSNVREIGAGIVEGTPNAAAGLIVDLTSVTYLDSAGLNCLFEVSERLRTRRQRFCLVVPPDSLINRIMVFSNFKEVAALVNRVDDALVLMSSPADPDDAPD